MAKLAGLDRGKDRNSLTRGTPFRLQEGGKVEGDICEGDLIRIQMDQLPTKADLAGAAAPFPLREDEGIGHATAFLYYIPLRVLLLQRQRSGVSPAAVAGY